MSTEPTRAPRGDYIHDDCRVVGCSVCAERGRVEPALRTPRLPAVEPVEAPAGPERGTGEPEAETSAQAATLHQASTSIHTIADHMPGRHPEFVRGVRYVATLLGHTATDLEDGDG